MQWYEKFKWFISSENYLVLSGCDAMQNELLVKRHLRRGDVYVYADVPGASSCIVRNFDHTLPIAPLTLQEAGHFCMCNSSAWESRTVTSAWWVDREQVSKTAPTGEYLPAGSFVVRGKKNYLQPSRLELGFGILFRIDEKTVATHHAGERQIRSMDVEAERARVAHEAKERGVESGEDKQSVGQGSEKALLDDEAVESLNQLDRSVAPPAPEAKTEPGKANLQIKEMNLSADNDGAVSSNEIQDNLAQAALLSAQTQLKARAGGGKVKPRRHRQS